MRKKYTEEDVKRKGRTLSRREFTVGSAAMLGTLAGTDAQQASRAAVGKKLTSPGVMLEVLNPLGEVEPPPTLGLNPRLVDLNGKTVALMDNWKTGGVYLQDRFEQLLKKKYPDIKILRTTKPQGKEGGGRLVYSADPWYPEVVKSADAFIYTIGD
jgi:hypothetical protein